MRDIRNPHSIGKGSYRVVYKKKDSGIIASFIGICENFNAGGLSAFWNESKEQMLLVSYSDILGLYPMDSTRLEEKM